MLYNCVYHTHTHAHCVVVARKHVSVCVFVCVRACVRACVCVCVCMCELTEVWHMDTEKRRVSSYYALVNLKFKLRSQCPNERRRKKSTKSHNFEITNKNLYQIRKIKPTKYHLGFKEENKNKKTWVILVSYTLFVQGVQMKIVDKVNYNTARTNWG